MIRYVLHEGFVTSRRDGQRHFIGHGQVARLYGVNPSECLRYPRPPYDLSWQESPGLIHLYPRSDGNYTLPSTHQGHFMKEIDRLHHLAHCGNFLVKAAHGASKDAGWWTHHKTGLDLTQVINNPMDDLQELLAGALVAQKLCLTHSEISEAMEGHRKGLMDDKLPHRTMLEVELADAVIRIADLAGALNLDLGGAIAEKMAFNAQRPDHKPKARQAEGGKAY